MKIDPELKIDDAWSEGSTYSPKRKRIGSGNNKPIRILIGILLVLIFFGGILYFFSRRPSGGDATSLQTKMSALEQKISEMERQLGELQGKMTPSGQDPAFLQRVDALSQRIEALEKQRTPATESKAKPSAPAPSPPKPAVSKENQYHTVQKGETLYRIGKRYGLSVEELRKLNNLSEDRPLRTGQKLLVLPRR